MSDERSNSRPKRRGKLTAHDARAIAECIARGERHAAVAARFGVSVETIGAIKSGTRWTSAIDDELRARMRAAPASPVLDAARAHGVMRALEEGRTGRSIAEEFGISPSMVSAIKHGRAWSDLDPGLPDRLAEQARQGKVLSVARVADLKRRLLEGSSTRKLADEFGVSASTVRAIAHGKTWTEVEPLRPPRSARETPAEGTSREAADEAGTGRSTATD